MSVKDSTDLLPEDFDSTKMPFGRHYNKPIKDVPLKYMDWVVGKFDEEGFGQWMGGQHDDFLVNLKLYMEQGWVVRELEKEIANSSDKRYNQDSDD